MSINQAERPLSWDVAMNGAVVSRPHQAQEPKLTIKIGDRRATFMEHCDTWDAAMLSAGVYSSMSGMKNIVGKCHHGQWVVWEINTPVRVRPGHICSQCGQAYSSRACGPTHALVWHRLEQEVLDPQ